jgi:hemerythrin-like domain-containing protein
MIGIEDLWFQPSADPMQRNGEPVSMRIAALKEEHEGILRRFRLLREAVGRHSPASTIRGLVSKLQGLVESHFAHEQDGLYEPMRSRSEAKYDPTRAVMAEHGEISRAFKRLISDMGGSGCPSTLSQTALRTRVEALERLVIGHMRKEEKVLFWMAELEL